MKMVYINGKRVKLFKYDKIDAQDLTIERIKEEVGDFEFKQTYACKKYIYMALLNAGFDIECYRQYMYIWTFTLNKLTIVGYTWEEFKNILSLIKEALDLGRRYVRTTTHRKDDKHGKWKAGESTDQTTAPYVLPVLIHNLKYEWAFMKSQINFPNDVFFKDAKGNDPLFAIGENSFLFIDSYKLYPMSLAEVAKCYTKTQKMVGDLDYNKERNYIDAKNLSNEELKYCLNDTRILSELAEYTWNTYFIPYHRLPLTQNQIVKNIIHYEYETALLNMDDKKAEDLQKQLKNMSLKQDQYHLIRTRGFRGGFCLSSDRDEKGEIIYGDETSAYFTAIMHGQYPMSKYRPLERIPTTEAGIDKKCERFCIQMKIKFYNLEAKGDKILKYDTRKKIIPYMPDGSLPRRTDKNGKVLLEDSKIMRKSIKTNGSGRIWKAACFTTSICDIDWYIYKKAYTWEKFEVLEMQYAERGPLPDYIKLTAIHLYEKKAKLKKAGKTHCPEYYTAKTLVSNVFGAIVQKKQDALIKGDKDAWLAATLDDYLKAQWGVYITAFARKVLCDMILSLGRAWLYSDTDSVYFLKTEETKKLIDIYNLDMKLKNYKMCQQYNLDYELFDDLGCFDSDDVKIKHFKTIGAKAYIYLTEDNNYKLVLAGIPERFFWEAYDKKYSKRTEANIFKFFEKDTIIEYHRNKLRLVENTDDVINGVKVHCDTGCIIEDDKIVGPLGVVTEVIALEEAVESMNDTTH